MQTFLSLLRLNGGGFVCETMTPPKRRFFYENMSKENNTKAAKAGVQAIEGRPALTHEYINTLYPNSYTVGTPGETGGSVWEGKDPVEDNGLPINRALLAAFRHPDWTLPASNGGPRVTIDQLELNMARVTSPEQTRLMAQSVVDKAQEGVLPPYGPEPERWVYKNGHVAPVDPKYQVELHQGLLETGAKEPLQTSQEMAMWIAQDIDASARTFSGYQLVDSSVPLSGHPEDEGFNQTVEGPLGPYVPVTVARIRPLVGIGNDTITEQVANQIAEKFGYKTFAEMEKKTPDLRWWINGAAHGNVQTAHETDKESGTLYTSRSLQDAEADMFNSDFATVAELLMFSTPMVLGNLISVKENGITYPLRDVGAAYRYTLRTTESSPSIGSSAEGNRRIKHLLYTGKVATMDRGSFVSFPVGTLLTDKPEIFPSLHERVRERMGTSTLPIKPLGRTEYTGRRATISVIDQLASNTLIRLYIVSANEAIANGMHPSQYFGEKYPYMKTANKHKHLAHLYNLHGTNSPEVKSLLRQNLRYLTDMRNQYPALGNDIDFVIGRIANMFFTSEANNLQEYRENPTGPIFDVIRREAEKYTPAQVVKNASNYQQEIGNQIQSSQGDMLQVVKSKMRR